MSMSEGIPCAIAITPRFAIDEPQGGRPSKIRLIDDFRAIGFNAIVSAADTEIPQGLDVSLATVDLFQARRPDFPPLVPRPGGIRYDCVNPARPVAKDLAATHPGLRLIESARELGAG